VQVLPPCKTSIRREKLANPFFQEIRLSAVDGPPLRPYRPAPKQRRLQPNRAVRWKQNRGRVCYLLMILYLWPARSRGPFQTTFPIRISYFFKPYTPPVLRRFSLIGTHISNPLPSNTSSTTTPSCLHYHQTHHLLPLVPTSSTLSIFFHRVHPSPFRPPPSDSIEIEHPHSQHQPINRLLLESLTMPPLPIPTEIIEQIARGLTDDKGKLCFADLNAFLQVDRLLYNTLNGTLWNEALRSGASTQRVFTHMIRTNDVKSLKFFLDLGADVHCLLFRDDFNNEAIDDTYMAVTPLQVATALDYVPMARLLLEYRASTVIYGEDDLPNHNVLQSASSAEMVQLLLQCGANPEQQDPDGYRPLHCYVLKGCIGAMQGILRHGVKVDPRAGELSHTPLHFAAQDNAEALGILLQHGAEVKKKDTEGHTALHLASMEGMADAVGALIAFWPDGVKMKDLSGSTALHLAVKKTKIEVVMLLASYWPEGVLAKDKDANTPLHEAANAITPGMAIFMAKLRPDSIREKNKWGNTPMHHAAWHGSAQLVRLLVEIWPEGAGEKNTSGNTPLHLAAWRGETETVKVLVERWPAGKAVINNRGRTPLGAFQASDVEMECDERQEILALLGGEH
jgi:ankyrin repeat protein